MCSTLHPRDTRQVHHSSRTRAIGWPCPVRANASKAIIPRSNALGNSQMIGAYPAYQAAPTFAYIIGDYTLDRQGILTGPHNDYLLGFLAQDGYQTKKKTATTIPARCRVWLSFHPSLLLYPAFTVFLFQSFPIPHPICRMPCPRRWRSTTRRHRPNRSRRYSSAPSLAQNSRGKCATSGHPFRD